MRLVPVRAAEKLKAEGMVWRDVAQELAWATGRKFAFDSVQSACYAARRQLHLPITPVKQPWIEDAIMQALWGLRLDTLDIAKKVGLRESQVANRLARLRCGEAA